MVCDLNLSEDQRQILDAAGAMLAAEYPVARLRGGGPEDLAALEDFGAFGLALPEGGFSVVDEALLHVLLGRHVLGPGAWASAVGARMGAGLVAAGVTSGEDLLVMAPGEAALVFDAEQALLVDLAGLDLAPEDGLGHGLPLMRAGPGWRRHVAARQDGLAPVAALLAAAQLLGMAEAARDMAVAYALERRQFGKPIGAFQAVKHRAADMALRAEMVSAQLDMAALALDAGAEDAAFQVAALARLAPRAALANARAAVQIHGGMGFSDEADVHHYVKRAHLLARLMPSLDMLGGAALLAPLRRETS